MRIFNLFLFLSFLLLCAIGNAQITMTDQVYNPDVKNIENNPMKGLMPGYTGIKSNFPYSTDHFYIKLNSVYKDWGKCDWAAFDKELNRIVSGGRHVVARFFIDYPGQSNGLPNFLLDNVGTKVPMYDDNSPNWNNDTLMVALEQFISLFGAKYDGDSRIVMIEAGLYGYWGEWHCYPENDWEMNQANKDRLIIAYNKAFKKTHIGLRHAGHPGKVALAKTVGYYDDSFCYQTLCTGGNWCFMYSLIQRGLTDNYKYHPMGGEIRPEVQSTLFNDWPNTVGEDITKSVTSSHMSFNKAFYLFKQQPTATQLANGLKMTKMMGYQFFVKSVQLAPAEADSFKLNLNIQNRGVAPIYYNWQVEFSAINSTGQWLGIIGTADWNTNTIYPDAANYLKTFSGKLPSKDIYKILMRFKNPLDSYNSNARVLRFANQKQDVDKSGWLTLGTIDLISTGTIRENLGLQNDVRIFPNPISTTVYIESNKNRIKEVSLYSISGMLLHKEIADDFNIQIDIKSLNVKDMILVKVNTNQNISIHKAFIR